MAQVPRGIGQVKATGAGTTPTQSFNTNAEMFGAVQAAQAKQVGKGLSDLSDAIQLENQRESERQLLEIEAQIRDWRYEQLQGENGVYTRRGGNAIGSTKAVTENYSKFTSQLLQGRELTPDARSKAEMYLKQQENSLSKEVAGYEREEKLDYDNGLREARVTGAKEDAATYYNDPQRIAESESKIRSTMRRNSEENGWSPEETQQQIEKEISLMHKAVITRMLANKQGDMAKNYLEGNRKEIDGADISEIEKAVNSGVITQKAQVATDSIMAMNLSQTDALKRAREEYSGEERDEIVKRVKLRYAEQQSVQSAQEKALLQSGWDKIASGGTPDSLTPQELAAAGRQVDSMWTMVQNRAQRGKGFALTSEVGEAEKYLGMDDSEIVDVDLNTLQPKLTEGDWNKVLKRQNDARQALEEMRDNPGMESDIGRAINEFAPKNWGVSATGNFTAKTSQAERTKINQAKDQLRNYLRDYIGKHNRRPTDDEMRKEAARIMLEVELDAPWLNAYPQTASELMEIDRPLLNLETDKAGTVMELSDENLDNFNITNDELSQATGIPPEALEEVMRVVRDADVPVTINNMVKLWNSREGQ